MYVLARSANKLIAALASAAMAASLCPVSAAFAQDATELSGAPAAMHEALGGAVVLEADAVTTAKSLINALPDAPQITAAAAGTYDAQIAAAAAAYDALPEADQKALDTETALTSNQPYGRVLECAQWALKAMREVDASTTLGTGTYSASTTPVLSSEYSKGKSTSARQRPWSVKDVTVVDGKAYGTVTVESDTYTYIYMAGQKFENTAEKNQHSTFENVPIDLNSTQYLTAYSTSMQTEIVFSITTTIDESATGGGTGGSTGGGETPGSGSGEGGGSTGGGTENPGGGSGSGEQEVVTPAQVAKLIEALPSDPYKITIADVCQIHDAQVAYESLTDQQRALVDVVPLPSGYTCQRTLEIAVWAVQSLAITDNTTTLADGVYYLKQGDMKSDMGISVSHRNYYWSVMKIVVSNGKATATLKRSGGNTPIASVYFEGRVLDANQDGTFTIPIALNTDMYFATKPRVDSTMESTVGLIYHLNTAFDVASAKPDATIEEDANGDTGDNPGGSGDDNSSSESTGALQGPVNTTGNVGTVGGVNTLGLTSGSNSKKASTKTAAADSDTGAAANSANAASGARSGGAAGDDGAEADTTTIPPLAVGGSFAGVALAGGAGFFALFRKREQH